MSQQQSYVILTKRYQQLKRIYPCACHIRKIISGARTNFWCVHLKTFSCVYFYFFFNFFRDGKQGGDGISHVADETLKLLLSPINYVLRSGKYN